MAAALLWPATRLAPGSLTKGALLVHKSQRRYLASKAGQATVVAGSVKKGAKADQKSGATNSTIEDLVWTSRAGWACVKSCGACCVLDKGPNYPPVEEILTDPTEAALYRSMVGPDGWCINFDKPSRSCTIHADRPRFCRVDPETFHALYGIEEHHMDKEACGFCQDQIRSVYGGRSKELKNFQRVVRILKKSS